MEELQDWLEERFTAVLDAGGQSGLVLEAELTALVQEFGAGQAGVEEAVRLGQVAMAEQMQAALAEVVERVAATGSQLEELHLTARTIRADVRRLLTLAQPLAPSGRQIRVCGRLRRREVPVSHGEISQGEMGGRRRGPASPPSAPPDRAYHRESVLPDIIPDGSPDHVPACIRFSCQRVRDGDRPPAGLALPVSITENNVFPVISSRLVGDILMFGAGKECVATAFHIE